MVSAQPVPYSVLLDSLHGPLILPRFDRHQPAHILRTGQPHIQHEIENLVSLVALFPDHPVALDVGANVGLIAIPLGRALGAKGGVLYAFEAQRLIYYMLAGNVALNGLSNVHCHHLAISDRNGELHIPAIDYLLEQDFGMVSLKEATTAGPDREPVRSISVDSLNLPRCDLMKLDVEGMEMQALEGARATLIRCRPWVWVEYWLAGRDGLADFFLQQDYRVWVMDELNLLCAPGEKISASGFQINAPELIRQSAQSDPGSTP